MRLDVEIRRWLRDKSQEVGFSSGHLPQSIHVTSVPQPQAWTIEGLDKEKALVQFGGSEETYLIILQSYVVNTPGLLEKIRTCTEENLQDYAIVVHGIKGTSYGICADVVGKQAETLEQAARQSGFQYVSKHNDEFVKATEELIGRIKTVLRELKVME
jgi:HPt (histidine-containing phosphotransfer) domain-containing protein